jgi:type II secretory pathway pseudopilin PulG
MKRGFTVLELIFGIIACAILAGFIVWYFKPTPARAQEDSRWLRQAFTYHHHYRPRYFRGPAYRRYDPTVEEVERIAEEERCRGPRIEAIGEEHASQDAALKSADKRWQASVRFDFGEKWMDLTYARRYESRCQRSSTGESLAAKVTDAITGGGAPVLYRCKVWAIRCVAPRKRGAEDQ